MFLGHFALGFGAKKVAPAVSLGALILAAQFADLLWPVLVLAGVERVEVQPGATALTPLDFVSYPYSHSLVALVAYGALFGIVYAIAKGSRLTAGVTLGLLVLSHWVLDGLTHRPDMPVTIGGAARVGFGLWNSVPATVAIEVLLFAAGIRLYQRATIARDRTGSVALWTLVAFLIVIYVVNVLGPPPPSATAVAWAANGMWLLVLWGFWADRHRTAVVR